jgi:hypothetical protein
VPAKPKWSPLAGTRLFLALLIIATVIVGTIHRAAFRPEQIDVYLNNADARAMYQSFQTVKSPADGLKWFYGNWPDFSAHSYRPLSGYLHWFEYQAGKTYGYETANYFTAALVILCAALVGLLAYRFTGSRVLALLGCAWWSFISPVDNLLHPLSQISPWYGDWLVCWPYGDNLLALAFLLASLVAFDTWLKNSGRLPLGLALGFGLCAILSKETAYPLCLMWLILACYRVKTTRGHIRAVVSMAAMTGGVLAIRTFVVPRTYDGNGATLMSLIYSRPQWEYLRYRLSHSSADYGLVIMELSAVVIFIPIIVMLASVIGTLALYRYRRALTRVRSSCVTLEIAKA